MNWLLTALLLKFCFDRNAFAVDHPEEFVNLLTGSFTDGDRFSTGNTLPLVGRPWGFNHWAPQTKSGERNVGSWWFKGSHHTLTWIRCTHQPSPWIGDWGWFIFTPQMGNANRNPSHFWEPRGAVMKPYLFDATVAPHGIRIELTPTDHGAMLRVTFPKSSSQGEKRICFAEANWDSSGKTDDGRRQYITGRSTKVHSERMLVTNFALHLRAESEEAKGVGSHADMRCFEYKYDATVVHVRIGTSLISPKQAVVNFGRELKLSKDFDTLAYESKMVWNRILKRVDVLDAAGGGLSEAAVRHLTVFYTNLYRALTFPRRLDEINEFGEMVHYSPYDPHGRVHKGPLVTDNGFWDTFRTVYPLLSLLYPEHLGTIIQGWLNAYKEGGWLPSWASPGYRNCMVGTYADVTVADAIIKHVPGFDLDLAKEAILKDSFEESPRYAGGAVGKTALHEYVSKGYLSTDRGGGDTVSRTLDYGYADYAVAQALIELAHRPVSADAEDQERSDLMSKAHDLLQRARSSYTKSFDSRHGLMVPRTSSGQLPPRFSPIEWGNGYTEGNAWHHSFPPYAISSVLPSHSRRGLSLHSSFRDMDTGGLVSLYGSKEGLLRKLHELLETPSDFKVGSYRNEIHEMTEMRALAMGQYGHNNQPSHHILYLFALLGDRETTETTVRQIIDRAYGVDFYAGDEDNGEQGAWFVLSALGLFSVSPGATRDYVLGSPIFRHVRISRYPPELQKYETYYEKGVQEADMEHREVLENFLKNHNRETAHLDILALGTAPDVLHVEKVTFNGTLLTYATIDDMWIQNDGILRFYMKGEETTDIDETDLHKISFHKHQKNEKKNLISIPRGAHLDNPGDEESHSLGEIDYLKMQHEIEKQKNIIDALNTELRTKKVNGESRNPADPDSMRGALWPLLKQHNMKYSIEATEAEKHPVSLTTIIYTLLLFIFLGFLLSRCFAACRFIQRQVEKDVHYMTSKTVGVDSNTGENTVRDKDRSERGFEGNNSSSTGFLGLYTSSVTRALQVWLRSQVTSFRYLLQRFKGFFTVSTGEMKGEISGKNSESTGILMKSPSHVV